VCEVNFLIISKFQELAASAGESDVKSLVSSIVSGVLAGASAGSSGNKGQYGYNTYGQSGNNRYGQNGNRDTYQASTTYGGYVSNFSFTHTIFNLIDNYKFNLHLLNNCKRNLS